MRRRRFLIASFSALAGCTATGYRATGPRTPPLAPETEISPSASVDPVEARAQAVIRPLNEVYRLVRGPLGGFDVGDVAPETLDDTEESLARAREALGAFSGEVANPPTRYQSLPALVTAHEHLVEGLTGAVECWSALSRLDESVDSPAALLDTARSAREAFVAAGTALREVADGNPTVPAAVFLTVERMRAFASTLETQSTVAERLVDASGEALEGWTDWRTAMDAFERDAFEAARTTFDDARVHYRAGVDALDGVENTENVDGSFVDLVETWACVARAGVDATAVGFDAVDAATAGDVARAERLLERAETTRTRCES
ncbi:hypothetical protein C2R22_16550 [Salinigranum rubrum]|uniref:Uncharacterized protein n=2 Tax=Salinigranum rubrum TaxID=755307 RepID=A0A2I8VMA0_9EURY|nr:hypothetical protein C2R22_16550 [Salinigranum rubrum]